MSDDWAETTCCVKKMAPTISSKEIPARVNNRLNLLRREVLFAITTVFLFLWLIAIGLETSTPINGVSVIT